MKLKQEDIDKFATEEEKEFLKESEIKETFEVGDIVMYSRNFVRSMGIVGPWGFMEGKVLDVEDLSANRKLITVQWKGIEKPMRVLSTNLILKSQRHLEHD